MGDTYLSLFHQYSWNSMKFKNGSCFALNFANKNERPQLFFRLYVDRLQQICVFLFCIK